MIKYLLPFGIYTLLTSHSYAQNPSEQLLENALKCDHNFEPVEIIKSLQKDGVIGEKPIFDEDGIKTYSVIKSIKIFGKDIKIVEGWSPNKFFNEGSTYYEKKHIAVGVGELVTYDHSKSLDAELEKDYPPCYTKIGVRDNLDSNYWIDTKDKHLYYLMHVCSLGDQIMRNLDKCSK